ncbi:acyl-CoA dehydrogenase family protein [Gordonia terrae]|uniref:Acyl-CoA dehydrogenase n=2 Tax=Gordonia terrae TaxID=2055 RepID=A0AAD0KBN3_9ACTN|nr:acyl-CoA dehydrogenase family protein [Gordonia terrae]VTR09645.1 acyl-CoA dehydrogenase [Clostridioides difficile]ANY22252.1 acyl-CoA dehydrogenase [Gordonia terrae]AWO82991.1 acyl-CoA dehydrogenase [Gordonia terrae]VTS30595.1 Acyl-CoA dehydrogenase, short-chain specific [Gordonia terrae]GAB46275.1 hypothetical protein GOTRE_150_00170 [Gordonia terrae NBRC 100016]
MSEMSAELISATSAMLGRFPLTPGTPAPGVDEALWEALSDAGFTSIDVAEDAGGQGGTLADAAAVFSTLTEAGAITPFAEHALLGTWLAGSGGLSVGNGISTVAAISDGAVRFDGDRLHLTGAIRDVVHVSTADVVVVLVETVGAPMVATFALDGPGVNLGAGTDAQGVSFGDVVFEDAPASESAPSSITSADLTDRGALVYAIALTAAATAVRDLTVRYASERTQFGRPLVKFQAIQHRIAMIAAQTTLMETAVATALRSAADRTPITSNTIAAAKIVTSLHAHQIAAGAHQIHGAIGFTSEHHLGRHTTALWSWRDRYGTETQWADELGARILDSGTDPWDVITGTVHSSATGSTP